MSLCCCLLFFVGLGAGNAKEWIQWDDFPYPYDTQVKEWKFLHEEPAITLQDVMKTEPTDTFDIIYDLMARVLGSSSYASQFTLELVQVDEADRHSQASHSIYLPQSRSDHPFWSKYASSSATAALDIIELDTDGTNIILRGTSTIALAVAFNWYLEEVCNTTYDWRTYSVDLPNDGSGRLPLPSGYQRKQRSVPLMWHQNVCTVSYSFAWFDWDSWQKHIDWMVLQGINMALAFNGQEFIWAKTFAQFGFSSVDLSQFFVGPAFYAWGRMGNIQGWGGPLREEEIMNQYNLQLKILARMNTFGITPALTCFAGHVPEAITVLYPDANITTGPNWGKFPPPYCCVKLLDASDPLFYEIGKTFIEIQTKYFGTSHIYQCDAFNEMNPVSSDPTYLQSYSSSVYRAMEDVDENAIWLMQGWLFLFGFWNNITVPAFLSGVADDAMIILDLKSEVTPIYSRYSSYYGKPFVWNTLHDFGGHNGIQGNLQLITNGFVDALNFPNTSVIGIGTTMEGIWQNYIEYSTTYKMGYRTQPIVNLTQYATRYAYSRYGLPHTIDDIGAVNVDGVMQALASAWIQLVDTLYDEADDQPQLNYVSHTPAFNFSQLNHDPMTVQAVWRDFVSVGDALQTVEKFRYDLVDVTRQALSDLFNVNYQEYNTAFYRRDVNAMKKYGTVLMEIAADLDTILLTNVHWMLASWVDAARNQTNDTSNNNDTKNWYEFNAKMQITLWGTNNNRHLDNYAAKQWADVVGNYYAPQWQMFIEYSTSCIDHENGLNFSQDTFDAINYDSIELPWSAAIGGYHHYPQGDTIEVACILYQKWNLYGQHGCM